MTCGQGPLTGAALTSVTEGLKVLLLLSNRTAAQGEAAQVMTARFSQTWLFLNHNRMCLCYTAYCWGAAD